MYENLLTFSISVFTGFFAVMNPIANTPIFLGLTGDQSKKEKIQTARTASIAAFIIVMAFVVLGKYIFEIFGITIPAFKISGGLLLFHVGFDMLQSKKSKIKNQEDLEPDNSIAISPLAIPILAGPGTIVTAMNNVTDANLIHVSLIAGIFGLMVFLNYLCFSLSDLLLKRIGENIITVIGKLMGLILTIIGAGMAVEGIKLAFDL